MKIAEGQVWKRRNWDQYILIESGSFGDNWAGKCIAGKDAYDHKPSLHETWYHGQCDLYWPVMCIKCGTARPKLNPAGCQFAEGLLCWSCDD